MTISGPRLRRQRLILNPEGAIARISPQKRVATTRSVAASTHRTRRFSLAHPPKLTPPAHPVVLAVTHWVPRSFGRKWSEAPGFPGKSRKHHAETTEPSRKSEIRVSAEPDGVSSRGLFLAHPWVRGQCSAGWLGQCRDCLTAYWC